MVTDPKGLHLYVGLGFNPSTGVDDGGTIVLRDRSCERHPGGQRLQRAIALSRDEAWPSDPRGRFFFEWMGHKAWNDR